MKLLLSLFDFCFRTFQLCILNFKLSNQLEKKWKFSAINFSSNRWNLHLHILLIMSCRTVRVWWEMTSFHTLAVDTIPVLSANCQVPSRENFTLCVHFKILCCYFWKLLRFSFLRTVTVWVINKTHKYGERRSFHYGERRAWMLWITHNSFINCI